MNTTFKYRHGPRTRRSRRLRSGIAVLATGSLLLAGCSSLKEAQSSEYPSEPIRIMVPAAAGGGYDQLGRAVQNVLTSDKLADNVEVYNVPGGGGTAGLAQFVSQYEGNPYNLMAMGLVLVGSEKTTDSPVSVEDDTTPMAALASEYIAIVVKKDSDIADVQDLANRLKDDPKSVVIGGSVSGSIDHVLLGMFAQALGIDPKALNYVPYESGGEQTTALLSGDADVAVSGVNEFGAQLDSGEMRALVVSSAEPLEGVDAPTFVQSGYGDDLVVANWRGILGPPGLSEEQQADVVALLDEMRGTQAWKDLLADYGWDDTYIAGAEFESYIDSESDRMQQALLSLGLISN